MSLALILLKQIAEIKLFIRNVECLLDDSLLDTLENRIDSVNEISGIIALVENVCLSRSYVVRVYNWIVSIFALRAEIVLAVHLLSA